MLPLDEPEVLQVLAFAICVGDDDITLGMRSIVKTANTTAPIENAALCIRLLYKATI